MRFENVFIESFGYVLPSEVVTSEQIEERLEPLYERLKLPRGRLELMSGIRQRRFWPHGVMPSQLSVSSCNLALEVADFERSKIGALIHGSVCRDHLEPATACSVHHRLDLPGQCVIYDVSNACLGILNGMIQAANMIELGQIQAALVVGSEGGRQLVETTIDTLNRDTTLTRHQVKRAFASLTIGSASCAVLLTNGDCTQTGNRMLGAVALANTKFYDLCRSNTDQGAHNMQPLMDTDAKTLMREGVETGRQAFLDFQNHLNWSVDDIQHTIVHQVGAMHRKLYVRKLQLRPEREFVTFPWLGNTGSAALPVTMAIAMQQERWYGGDQVAMLGIGSGINSVIIGAQWQRSLAKSSTFGEQSPESSVSDELHEALPS